MERGPVGHTLSEGKEVSWVQQCPSKVVETWGRDGAFTTVRKFGKVAWIGGNGVGTYIGQGKSLILPSYTSCLTVFHLILLVPSLVLPSYYDSHTSHTRLQMQPFQLGKICKLLEPTHKVRAGTPSASNFVETIKNDRELNEKALPLSCQVCVHGAPQEQHQGQISLNSQCHDVMRVGWEMESWWRLILSINTGAHQCPHAMNHCQQSGEHSWSSVIRTITQQVAISACLSHGTWTKLTSGRAT